MKSMIRALSIHLFLVSQVFANLDSVADHGKSVAAQCERSKLGDIRFQAAPEACARKGEEKVVHHDQ